MAFRRADGGRGLRDLIRREKNPRVRQRLLAISLLEGGRLSWSAIHRKTGVPRSTAYHYLRLYRMRGAQCLAATASSGRPQIIPNIVRERFRDLLRSSAEGAIVCVFERETAIYRALRFHISSRQIARWYARLAADANALSRFRKFRKIGPAFPYLDATTRERYADGLGKKVLRSPQKLRHEILLEGLENAARRAPQDRTLRFRFLRALGGRDLWEEILLSMVHNNVWSRVELSRFWSDEIRRVARRHRRRGSHAA